MHLQVHLFLTQRIPRIDGAKSQVCASGDAAHVCLHGVTAYTDAGAGNFAQVNEVKGDLLSVAPGVALPQDESVRH